MGKATNTAKDTDAAAPAGASRKAPATVTRKRPATMAKAKPPPMAKAKAATARTKPATVAASSAITIGYARVSTHQQSLALQLDALEPLCGRIYQETVSGAGNVPRPQLEECIKALRPGDVLMVHSLSRLGRSNVELITLVDELSQRGISVRSLTDSIDTSGPAGRLILNVFAALAQMERDNLIERTKAGLAAARARGRIGGRSPVVTKKDKSAMQILYDSNELSVKEICKRYGISRSTFYRAVLGDDYKHKEDK